MGRPLNCCADCADVFKIDKDTGQIVWTKNLGFDATAIQVFEDKIYVATDYYGIGNLSDKDYTSIYDIIVLDLNGNLILDECLTFLPKIRLSDIDSSLVENTENDDEYKGVVVKFPQIISEMFIFRNNDKLYINAVISDYIFQIVDGEIKFITHMSSIDKKKFIDYRGQNYLDFSCGETNNLPYTSPINVEFGYNYVTYKKNNPQPNLKIPDFPLDIDSNGIMLIYLSESYEYVSIDGSFDRFPYVKTTDNLTYTTYTFEVPIQGIIYPTVVRVNENVYNIDNTKRFDQTVCGTSNGYFNITALDSTGNLEDHANIIFGLDKPIPPAFYIARLDLLTYQYEYIPFECINSFDNLKDMIDKSEIEGREITVRTYAYGDPDDGILKSKLDLFDWEIVDTIFGPLVRYTGPPARTGILECSHNIKAGSESVFNTNFVELEIDDSINCGYVSDIPDEVFSYDIIKTKTLFIDSLLGSTDYFFFINPIMCPATSFENPSKYILNARDLLGDDTFALLREYLKTNIKCKAKLTSFNFSQISKSYEKNNKIVFNAIMVGNWATYTDIYAIKSTVSEGTSISGDEYIWFRDHDYLEIGWNGVEWEQKPNWIIGTDLDNFPKDNDGNYYYKGSTYTVSHFYRTEFSLNLKLCRNKLSPFGYVHTNTKVLITLDKTTNQYSVELDNSDEFDFKDYNISLDNANRNSYIYQNSHRDYGVIDLYRRSNETTLRDITYLGAGKINWQTIGIYEKNVPNLTSTGYLIDYKLIYRDYEYSPTTNFYIPDNLIHKKLINQNGLKYRESSYSETRLNDTDIYIDSRHLPLNRLMVHDTDNEYITINSFDGRNGISKINYGYSYVIGSGMDATGFYETLVFFLHYNYNFDDTDEYILELDTGNSKVELKCSVKDTRTQEIVNWINSNLNNSNQYNVQTYIDTTLKDGIISILPIDPSFSLPITVKQSPYAKEKYNVFKFTDGELMWKTNILMPPRTLNEYTDKNREYNSYVGDSNVFILDIAQDDGFLYLATNKRRRTSNIPVTNDTDIIIGEGKLSIEYCNEKADQVLKNLIDYPNKKMKNV